MNITPDQARELLDNTTPSPWEIHPDHGTVEPDVIGGEGCRFEASDTDLDLIVAAPDLAQTIAGMLWEYTFQTRPRGLPWRSWTTQEGWFDNRDDAYRAAMNVQDEDLFNCRLVRRLAGPVEVVE